MNEADRRGATTKGGPRVFTLVPDLSLVSGLAAATVNNCPTCPIPAGVRVVNEDGIVGKRDLLVHGWYTLESDINIFWQQVNPKDACSTDPLATGNRLSAGSCIAFFVDQSVIDGVIVISTCPISNFNDVPVPCGGFPSLPTPLQEIPGGFVRINRVDTILKMSETGDNATKMAATPSAVCGPPPPLPKV